jgi:membrane protein YdbS with pleckstrin-like domain
MRNSKCKLEIWTKIKKQNYQNLTVVFLTEKLLKKQIWRSKFERKEMKIEEGVWKNENKVLVLFHADNVSLLLKFSPW